MIARRISLIAAAFSVLLLLLAFCTGSVSELFHRPMDLRSVVSQQSRSHLSSNRKLLQQGGARGKEEPNRIGEACTKDDIVVYQGATAPLPNGIPTYTVEVLNVCVSGCSISRIHLSCGWFSSARLINPRVFKRLRFGDCLLNDGKPLPNGASVSFQYANSFPYPLSVSSVSCHS